MDIDSPPSDTYTNPHHPTHTHLVLPSLSASFPLPFRVLFLIGLAQLLWALNLHILYLLGLDTSWILDFRDDSEHELDDLIVNVEGTELTTGSTTEEGVTSIRAERKISVRPESGKLYQPVYKLFLIYCAWVGSGWALFTVLTGSDTESMERWRGLVGVIALGVIGGSVIPWRGVGERERRGLRRAIQRIVLPPTKSPIFFSDVIFADILTSLAKVLGDLWISACQIWSGGITQGRKAQPGWSSWVMLLMTCLPYLMRFRQCLLEFHQSGYKSPRPLANALKYFSAFPVIFLSAAQKTVVSEIALSKGITVQELGDTGDRWHGEHLLFRLWLLAVIVNSMFSFYWDVRMDWGLALCDLETWVGGRNDIRPEDKRVKKVNIWKKVKGLFNKSPTIPSSQHQRSPFPTPGAGLQMTSTPLSTPPITNTPSLITSILSYGLRPILLLPDPSVYHLFTLIDLILRFTWSLKLSSHLHTISEIESGVFMMEALELLRRWGWVFIRIEWEAVKMGEIARWGVRRGNGVEGVDQSNTQVLWDHAEKVDGI